MRLTIMTGLLAGLLCLSPLSMAASQSAVSSSMTAPVLDEASILKNSGLTIVRRYEIEDGHGFYVQQSPDAAIEFRSTPPRINIALRTFPESGYEKKNASAQAMVRQLAATITGTDGHFVDDVITGNIKPGKQSINGLSVNISGMENNWLITIKK